MKDINRDINQPKPFKSELLSRMGGRIEFIDLAKGFCIILVVMHHIEQEYGLSSYMDNVMYMFRMPLYFLLSGLFFKTYNGFKGFLIKKINKLLIPFFFFYITTSVALPNFVHFILGFPMERSADGLGVKSLYLNSAAL